MNRVISVLIAIVTVFATLVAYIQVDAAHKDDRANRDSKRYALESFGLSIRGHAAGNFAYHQAFKTYHELERLGDQAEYLGQNEAAQAYHSTAEEMTKHSELFSTAAPKDYYDKAADTVDIERYEADAYVVRVAKLEQQFKAASLVKNAWDTKATTYIVHLTLLAIALFLLGQASTMNHPLAKQVLIVTGVGMTLVATIWIFRVWAPPVFDLREVEGAIDHYATGAGFDHRGLLKEAVAEYDLALKVAPDYLDALLARGYDHLELENWAEAAADFEKAHLIEPRNTAVLDWLSQAYYGQGDFAKAISTGRQAVALSPDNVAFSTRLGLALLASGQIDEAQKQYQQGMDLATALVATAKEKGEAPPAFIWETLDESSLDLDDLMTAVGDGEGSPPKDKVTNPDQVQEVADPLHDRIDALAISLEYRGKAPEGTPSTEIGKIGFGLPIYDDDGELKSEIKEYPDDAFPAGTGEVVVEFPYGKVQNGQELVMRVFFDGQELPSWRMVETWELGQGDGETDYWYKVLSPGYSEATEFEAGNYFVEIFLDGHLLSKDSFSIVAEE